MVIKLTGDNLAVHFAFLIMRHFFQVIVAINRAQIINDAWSLAKSGDLSMSLALQTTNYLQNEREYVPWSAATSQLSFVSSMLVRDPLYGSFSVSYLELFFTNAFSPRYSPFLPVSLRKTPLVSVTRPIFFVDSRMSSVFIDSFRHPGSAVWIILRK